MNQTWQQRNLQQRRFKKRLKKQRRREKLLKKIVKNFKQSRLLREKDKTVKVDHSGHKSEVNRYYWNRRK